MTSEYRKYRGRSVGRILHALNTYCRNYWQLDSMIIGDGKVTCGHNGPLFATYTWNSQDESDDVPYFEFMPTDRGEESPWMREQEIMRPFLDYDRIHDGQILWQEPGYMVQEVRKYLRFDDALFIHWIRDKFHGDWSQAIRPQIERIEKRVKRILRKITWDRQGDEWYDKYWKHFAMCAVLEI